MKRMIDFSGPPYHTRRSAVWLTVPRGAGLERLSHGDCGRLRKWVDMTKKVFPT